MDWKTIPFRCKKSTRLVANISIAILVNHHSLVCIWKQLALAYFPNFGKNHPRMGHFCEKRKTTQHATRKPLLPII